MPYVITTLAANFPPEAGHTVSRQAVATLEAAREEAAMVVAAPDHDESWDEWARTAYDVPESGGTVGPLPDGTVIEVERLSPLMLSARAGVSGAAVMECLHADDWSPLIAAFNAREATP